MDTVTALETHDNRPLSPYAAISEQAEAIGWPLVHAVDLTEKDALICAELGPSDAFLWVLREAGTTLLIAKPDLDPIVVESRLANLERVAGPCRFFWWDAGELSELGDAEEAAYVLEDRVREMRWEARRALASSLLSANPDLSA
jgi:hypothetical protein